jgi:hypothetical protein
MNKKVVYAIIVIIVLVGIVFLATDKNAPTRGKLMTGSDKETFSGTITAFSTDCFADGICSVTVDGKKVIIMAGFRMSPPPVGKLIGVDSIGALEGKIGSHANVYATTTPEGDYTLYGSENYYVEVVDAK